MHGEGPPLVCAAWWVSHVEDDWRDARFRETFETLGARRLVVRYDRPGVGLSDRDCAHFDLATEVENLRAVIDHVGLERIELLGFSCGGPAAITLAAEQPGRVSRLVLCDSFLRGSEILPVSARVAVRDLVRAHWGLGSRVVASLFVPDLAADDLRRWGARQRASASAETAARLLELTFGLDASAAAGRVRCPTRVLHRRGDETIPFENGRRLAAAIPRAELVPLEGRAHVPWEPDPRGFVRAVLDGDGDSTPRADHGSLCRQGKVWEIDFAGRRVHIEHRKGLSDLATLLAHPGAAIHALDLARGAPGSDDEEREPGEPLLDARAKAEIARRACDLDEAVAEAEALCDRGRLQALAGEREALLEALSRARGLGRRDRRMPSPTERARKAVAARLRDAVARIAAVHPELGRHLVATLHTGTRCRYQPDGEIVWRV